MLNQVTKSKTLRGKFLCIVAVADRLPPVPERTGSRGPVLQSALQCLHFLNADLQRRFSGQKPIPNGCGWFTILVILLVSLLCLDVVSRTARVSPENPTVSAAIGQIVPQSDKTKCISVKRKGNTTFAEAEEGSRDFSAMAAGWTYATTIKDAAAEEFWAVLEKTELTPHINAFTLTGSGTKFRVLYRLDWADTDAPMLYLGLTADGQIWIFRELVLPQFVPACRVQLAGGSDGFRALTQAYSDILAAHPA